MIHVFIGTKAQYIKMAPLLRRMDGEQVEYRLIDSGQHSGLAAALRGELGLREPDVRLGTERDVVSIPQALVWTLGLLLRLVSRSRLREGVFGGHDGVCVVHGDTPSTLLSAWMAKRAGMDVAHVEAGLRTFRWLHPFPEEIVRVLVSRVADIHFAPGPVAAANLRNASVRGRVLEQPANTVLESVSEALGAQWEALECRYDRACSDAGTQGETDRGAAGDAAGRRRSGSDAGTAGNPVVVTMHRVENLYRRSRNRALIDAVAGLAANWPVRWVVHGPTEKVLAGGARQRLGDAGVELVPLQAYRPFLTSLAAAPFVITDGGSIQEECALLGVPTLVWRDRTDRQDGLGDNVVLSHYDPAIVAEFLNDPQRYRRRPRPLAFSPSEQILDVLDGWR